MDKSFQRWSRGKQEKRCSYPYQDWRWEETVGRLTVANRPCGDIARCLILVDCTHSEEWFPMSPTFRRFPRHDMALVTRLVKAYHAFDKIPHNDAYTRAALEFLLKH